MHLNCTLLVSSDANLGLGLIDEGMEVVFPGDGGRDFGMVVERWGTE